MSVPMKKHLTEVEIYLGNQQFRFSNIPSSKVKPILISLKEYRNTSIPWRELAKERLATAENEGAYMVRTSRKARNMTQSALASLLEMPQANLSQIEKGKRPIGKNLAKKLSKVFDLDYRTFL